MDRPATFQMRAHLSQAVAPAWAAVRSRIPSILLIQACGLAFVVAYFSSPAFRAALDDFGAAKARMGLAFAAIGSYIAGAIIPELARTVVGDKRWTHKRFRDMNHTGFLFIVNGVMTELMFSVQQRINGSDPSLSTLVRKVSMDALIYTPLISVPVFLMLVLWREEGWSLNRLRTRLHPSLITDRIIPMLIPAWIYWIPLQFCYYALPLNLQYPVALFGVAAWSLVLVYIARREDLQTEPTTAQT